MKQVSECTYFDYWTKPKALGLSRQRGKRSGKQLGQQQLLLPLLLLPPRLLLLFLLLPLLWLLVLLLPCGCCCCCCCRLRPYFLGFAFGGMVVQSLSSRLQTSVFSRLGELQMALRQNVRGMYLQICSGILSGMCSGPLHPEPAKEKKMRGTQDRRRTCTFVKI